MGSTTPWNLGALVIMYLKNVVDMSLREKEEKLAGEFVSSSITKISSTKLTRTASTCRMTPCSSEWTVLNLKLIELID